MPATDALVLHVPERAAREIQLDTGVVLREDRLGVASGDSLVHLTSTSPFALSHSPKTRAPPRRDDRFGRLASQRSSRSIAEFLLIDHPAERGRHPGALVEAERAGGAPRIDAEPDAVLA